MNTTPDIAKTKKQLKELVAVLTVQFILGVLLTTVIDYNADKATTVQNIVLGTHIFLGVYILVIASIRLTKAYQWKTLIKESWWGLGSVIVAFSAGSVASQNGNTWATLVMALGFVVALLSYGKALVSLNSTK